jgi:hypothetical protein
MEVRLAALRGQQDLALKHLGELCVQERASAFQLEEAAEALAEAGWQRPVEEVWRKALETLTVQPQVGELWVKSWTARGDWAQAEQLAAVAERGEAGSRALVAFAVALGKAKKTAELRSLTQTYGEILRGTTRSWSSIGYAFGLADDFQGGIDWLSNWTEYADVQPVTLINLALDLRSVGRHGEAIRIHKHALILPNPDFTTPYHEVWVAIDYLLAGQTEEGTDQLDGIDVDELDPYHRFLFDVAEAMLLMQQTAPEERGAAFAEAKGMLVQAVATSPESRRDPALPKTYRRCVRRIAGDRGGFGAAVWSVWRCLRPLLPREEKSK